MKIQFNHILNYILVMTFFSDCTASSKCLNVVVKNVSHDCNLCRC